MTTSKQAVKWTVHAAATEFGVTERTLLTRLREHLGEKPKPRQEFSTRQVHLALSGDLHRARTRLAVADAEAAELKLARTRGDTLNRAEVASYITASFSPVRERILQLPSIADKCNPADPAHARQQLQDFADQFLRSVREHKPAKPEPIES